jgi:serine/threonine protein kinase
VSLVGKGGMGEVYLGTDTRLDRPVAIKVSSREFNDRFERESKAISSLNHPNICTLYDVGPNYLVMELVEGESLAAIIGRGPLPLDQALKYAIQIVDALAAAHARSDPSRLSPATLARRSEGADFGYSSPERCRAVPAKGNGNGDNHEDGFRVDAVLHGSERGARTPTSVAHLSFGVVFYDDYDSARSPRHAAAVLASC